MSQPARGISNERSPIVLYDGVCGLCNRLNQFLLKRDRHNQLRFASLQSDFAAQVLRRHNLNHLDLDTVWVVVNHGAADEEVLARSDAILHVIQRLGGFWKLAVVAKVLPATVRNALYRIVAANRYKVFGKYEVCMMPDPKYRDKFIEV